MSGVAVEVVSQHSLNVSLQISRGSAWQVMEPCLALLGQCLALWRLPGAAEPVAWLSSYSAWRQWGLGTGPGPGLWGLGTIKGKQTQTKSYGGATLWQAERHPLIGATLGWAAESL